MKNIFPIILIGLVILGWIFYSKFKNNIQENGTSIVVSGESLSGQHLMKLDKEFSAFRTTDASNTQRYETYVKNRAYFEDLIENNTGELFRNQGLDIYPQFFYLCSVFEKSGDEESLRRNLLRGSSVILLSGDYPGAVEAYGGIDMINRYNKTILDYAERGIGTYSDFYSQYKATTDELFASAASDYVKRLGEVIVGIYGLGRDKFVDNKPLDCSKDMEMLLSGKNLNP